MGGEYRKFYHGTLKALLEFGAHQFKGAKQIGGGSVNDHLAVLDRKGRKPKRKDDAPQLPPGTAHLWNAFVKLHAARTGGGFGPNPVTYSEIEAYCRLSRVRLDPWEVDAIRALDDAFLEAQAKD